MVGIQWPGVIVLISDNHDVELETILCQLHIYYIMSTGISTYITKTQS